MRAIVLSLAAAVAQVSASEHSWGIRDDLHFPLHARATNKNGSSPVYKDPSASIEDRINDLLPRMTVQEKVAQLIQGDINGWMDVSDPLDDTLAFNQTGLEEMMAWKAGAIWGGYLMPWEKWVYAQEIGQRYLVENTTLGIPAMYQTEGLHGFTNNGTIWPSPIGLAASFNTDLLQQAAATITDEAEGLGFHQTFAPVLDLSRELRWGRVEENFGEDPYLTGEMGHAFVTGTQSGRRRNASDTATARMAATCKHFAMFGSPQGGLNIAQVSGGEREMRSTYLKPFNRACIESLSMMTAYSSYDGIPATANTHLLVDILRSEWGYENFITCDAGSIDLLITTHGTCDSRECAAKAGIEGISGEMGGGTYTFLTLPDQIAAGNVSESVLDETVKTMLRIKFKMGLFEDPYPYADYNATLRTESTRELLHQMEQESIVLLENHGVLPLSNDTKSIALIGPQMARVSFGDYVFFNASHNGISPLDGFTQLLDNSSVTINYAQGCELWSNDQSGFDEAVSAAQNSEVAIVAVGTWSLDQTLLWTPGTNATTGEHVDVSSLDLVGAQLDLVKAIQATGVPTIVVLVSGKPLSVPWIQANADAVIQQFYPGELGGLALAEIVMGAANPSGKLPVSFPHSVGTTPVFYNYLKGSRPLDPGMAGDNDTLVFGHQYVLDTPVPVWSFGHGLSYSEFNYSDITLTPSTISATDTFNVTVTVTNSGSMDGAEVVQVYATDVVSSVVTPAQQLVGFKKVLIPAGSSETVSIEIQPTSLELWAQSNKYVVEPGLFIIKVGTSDETFATANLTVSA